MGIRQCFLQGCQVIGNISLENLLVDRPSRELQGASRVKAGTLLFATLSLLGDITDEDLRIVSYTVIIL